MDGHRFDDWARRLAANSSRRGVLRGLLGSAVGALGLAGMRGAGAVTCRSVGGLCRENANCCSGLCARDAAGRRTCRCQSPADCPRPGPCHQATCTNGVCSNQPAPNDTACDGDSHACCDGVCTDLASRHHCGSCGNDCGFLLCQGGQCV